jgi:hypothetical protein
MHAKEMRLQRVNGLKSQLRVALSVEANGWPAQKGPRRFIVGAEANGIAVGRVAEHMKSPPNHTKSD